MNENRAGKQKPHVLIFSNEVHMHRTLHGIAVVVFAYDFHR